MDRVESLNTTIGQAAYAYYCDWLKLQKRLSPKASTFMTSNYYNSFIKFAEFIKKVQIPDPKLFIELMIQRDMSPTLWTTDGVYRMYLEYIDRVVSPIRQAQITANVLLKLSESVDCETSEIFDRVDPNIILQMIRERKLTPWILLTSSQFKKLLIRSSPEQRKLFETLLRPTYWSFMFQQNPDIVKDMKKIVAGLGI